MARHRTRASSIVFFSMLQLIHLVVNVFSRTLRRRKYQHTPFKHIIQDANSGFSSKSSRTPQEPILGMNGRIKYSHNRYVTCYRCSLPAAKTVLSTLQDNFTETNMPWIRWNSEGTPHHSHHDRCVHPTPTEQLC